MLPELLQKTNLFHLLFRIDSDIADQCRLSGCPFCGGVLHQGNYIRKPRGGPESISEQYLLRHSFSCGNEGCRKRTLPGSCRFWGRRVYWGSVILVVMGLRQGRTTGYSVNKISRVFGINRKTICRWIVYFREQFPQTAKWQRLRGRVSACVEDEDLPGGLLQYFVSRYGSEENAVSGCLHFLAGS